jgi:hypothetical protein
LPVAGHPLEQRSAVRRAEIGRYPWIAPPAASPLYQNELNLLTNIGIQFFKVSFSGVSLSATVSSLTGSDALTVLPFPWFS